MSHPPILAPATEPIQAGDSLENPATGEVGVLLKSPYEGDDPSLESEMYVRPGGAVVGEHIHHTIDERFTVVSGTIGYKLDGKAGVAKAGEVVEIPRGSWHDWWNAGDDELVARVWVSDGRRFAQMIENLFGLAADGHTNAKGLPDPLQLAMFATEFSDVLTMRRPPAAIQKAIFGVLVPIANRRGYRATYPQYSRSLATAERAGVPA